ncbi:MAG: ammonium transporter [Leptolyngbyaceae bacterium]|nr:ammonium transporter [Leptolyngbyaceae bacterium]
MLDTLWVLLCAGLVFLMQAGFMCLESGLTRSKNNINVAVKNFLDFGISVALFWLFGYGLMFGVSQVGWLGWGSFVPRLSNPDGAVFFLFQAMFCGTATTIISGAIAERLNFTSYLLIAALVSGFIYPLFGHWAWNGVLAGNSGGWLQSLGFVDFAGSTVVHGTGAWVSLATLFIVGARQGRFTKTGVVNKIQGANMPFSVLGILLLWFGWIGFNGGSTLAFNDQVPGIVVNTMLAGVMGLLTAAGLSAVQYRRVEVEVIINGAIAGLVSITACCHVVTTPLAAIVGMTGAAVALLVDYWMVRSRLDDAVGAVAVHGGAGIWGTLCVALFGQMALIDTGLSRLSQIFVQLLGSGICFAWAFGISWVSLRLLNRVMPLRVSAQAELVGLNISEHHAKTDTYDLFQVMDQQAQTQDLSLRVPVEPFTEMGHIATRYNQVMANLERQHQQQVDDLGHIYHLVAIASSALETDTFTIQDPELEELSERHDDLGNLVRVFQQLLAAVQTRQQMGEILWLRLAQGDTEVQKQVMVKMVSDRAHPSTLSDSEAIADQILASLAPQATFADVLAAIDTAIHPTVNQHN